MRIWLTGASSGIGAALAAELERRGHSVSTTSRSGGTHPGDITDRARMHEIGADLGDLDLAVLNAGTYVPVEPDTFSADVFREHVDVNVLGTVHCIESVLPGMLERRRGRIAVVSSVTGYAALPKAAAYGATKAFLISMCDSLRADLAGRGVGVTVVAPGFVRTPLTDANDFPMPFLIDADEAARIVADGLEEGKDEIAFPFRMAALMKLLGALPGALARRYVAGVARRRAS